MPVETQHTLKIGKPLVGLLNRALRPAASATSAEGAPARVRLIPARCSLSRFVTALLAKFHLWLNAREIAAITRCAEARLVPCPARAPQGTPWRKR